MSTLVAVAIGIVVGQAGILILGLTGRLIAGLAIGLVVRLVIRLIVGLTRRLAIALTVGLVVRLIVGLIIRLAGGYIRRLSGRLAVRLTHLARRLVDGIGRDVNHNRGIVGDVFRFRFFALFGLVAALLVALFRVATAIRVIVTLVITVIATAVATQDALHESARLVHVDHVLEQRHKAHGRYSNGGHEPQGHFRIEVQSRGRTTLSTPGIVEGPHGGGTGAGHGLE